MNLIEIKGSFYNLDQLISLERKPKEPLAWKDENQTLETIVTFTGGIKLRLSDEEHDMVMQRIQNPT